MKKAFSFILLLLLVFGVTGCSDVDKHDDSYERATSKSELELSYEAGYEAGFDAGRQYAKENLDEIIDKNDLDYLSEEDFLAEIAEEYGYYKYD